MHSLLSQFFTGKDGWAVGFFCVNLSVRLDISFWILACTVTFKSSSEIFVAYLHVDEFWTHQFISSSEIFVAYLDEFWTHQFISSSEIFVAYPDEFWTHQFISSSEIFVAYLYEFCTHQFQL